MTGTLLGYGQNKDEERRMKLNFKSWKVGKFMGLQEIAAWAPDGNKGSD